MLSEARSLARAPCSSREVLPCHGHSVGYRWSWGSQLPPWPPCPCLSGLVTRSVLCFSDSHPVLPPPWMTCI